MLFMGTWCEDSQREVPAMIKILDQAGYSTANMEIVAIAIAVPAARARARALRSHVACVGARPGYL